MRLPIQIEAILFRKANEQIQFLLLKRVEDRGGFWQPVTGGLEKGETKYETLRREILEETGVRNMIRIIGDVHYFQSSDPHLFEEYAFGVEISPNERIIIDKNEHIEFKWCNFQKALKLMKWRENKEALRRLNQILTVLK